MTALPDINVLVAMLDPQHLHHQAAHQWFGQEGVQGWATCPLTENGCVRILTQPSYPGGCFSIPDIVHRLSLATGRPEHAFWPDDVSILDPTAIDPNAILGPRQLTDIYLLALCVRRGGRLITFDGAITSRAVLGATAGHMVVLG